MKKILFSAMALAMLGIFSGCSKDDDDDAVCTLSETSIKGTYKMTAWIITAAPAPAVDYFNLGLDACDRDDTYTLGDNGVYTLTDAGTQCTPAESDTGTWMLTGTTLSVDAASTEDIDGTVTNFGCNGFSVTFDLGGGVNTMTFVRQ